MRGFDPKGELAFRMIIRLIGFYGKLLSMVLEVL